MDAEFTLIIITINVPVVYMARGLMILMREVSIMRALEGVGPEVETFLGPEMATSEASAIWAQKSCLYVEASLAAFGFKF
jgi:hypothetical protein